MTFDEIIENIYRGSYRVYAGMALRMLRPMGQRAIGMVDEVVQETFVRALRKGQPESFFRTETSDRSPWTPPDALTEWDPPRVDSRRPTATPAVHTYVVCDWTEERLKEYIGGILRHVALDVMARAQYVDARRNSLAGAEVASTDPPVNSDEHDPKDIISRAWAAVDDNARQLLEDRFDKRMTIPQLAEKYGCAISTVHRRIERAIDALRREIRSSGKVKRQ